MKVSKDCDNLSEKTSLAAFGLRRGPLEVGVIAGGYVNNDMWKLR